MTNEQRAEAMIKKYGFHFSEIPKEEIRTLIEKEISDFQEGSSEYIRLLCGYLYCIGDFSDVPLMEKAKYGIHMDVGCMIDGEWIDSLKGIQNEYIRFREEIIQSFIAYYKDFEAEEDDADIDVKEIFDTGNFDVNCDSTLYGTERIALNYRIHTKFYKEDLSKALSFIQAHYRQAYNQVLAGVLSVYKRHPKWDVWMEGTKDFLRIDFAKKEEIHPYIGMPIIDLACYNERIFWGMTFPGGTNQLSLEHGFCAVLEQEKLLVLADTDFPLILQWWDYYSADGNMLIMGIGEQ